MTGIHATVRQELHCRAANKSKKRLFHPASSHSQRGSDAMACHALGGEGGGGSQCQLAKAGFQASSVPTAAAKSSVLIAASTRAIAYLFCIQEGVGRRSCAEVEHDKAPASSGHCFLRLEDEATACNAQTRWVSWTLTVQGIGQRPRLHEDIRGMASRPSPVLFSTLELTSAEPCRAS